MKRPSARLMMPTSKAVWAIAIGAAATALAAKLMPYAAAAMVSETSGPAKAMAISCLGWLGMPRIRAMPPMGVRMMSLVSIP